MAKNQNGYCSIALQALTQPQGGISASIGSSTYVDADVSAEFMNKLLYNTAAPVIRWGDALKKTQYWAFGKTAESADCYWDMSRTEQIFGDPAMPVFMKNNAAQPAKSGGVTTGTSQSSLVLSRGVF